MTLISSRLDVIQPSSSMAVTERACQLRAAGVDVISLSAGEPDFATPEHVVAAAAKAMRDGETRYTAVDGTPALKRAVADKFRRENGLDYRPDEITVGTGAKQVIYNALLATLEPGDEVVVPAPYWVSYTDIVLLGEGVPVVVPCNVESGFKLTAGRLAAAITPRTKWLMLNSPSNPTGAVYTRDELAALAQMLLAHPRVHVISDDIYEHILFDRRPFHTIAQVEPALRERVLTVNGVSKAYAMTGWRIGYAGGPRALVNAIAIVQSQSTSNPSSISQAAAVAALDGPQDLLRSHALEFQSRRDHGLESIGAVEGLSCASPDGAFYLYPNVSGLIGRRRTDGRRIEDDSDLSVYLLEEARVAVVQGAAYGLSPHVRLSFATSLNLLDEAITRVASALARLS